MKKLLTVFTILSAVFVITGTAHSAIFGVTSRANLAGDDFVDWGAQGYGTPWYGGHNYSGGSYLPIPVRAVSDNGIGMDLTNPPYNSTTITMSIRQQSLSWFGSFAPDDILIGNQWDFSSPPGFGPGPMTIHFDVPVFGLGAQINKFGMYGAGTFNASIEAYDSDWNSLGRVIFANLQFSGNTADDSAPFIGIVSDTGDISHVVISSGRSAHTINRLDLVIANPAAFPPAGAVASSPGTVGGVRLISGAGYTDTTSGAMLAISETLWESKYSLNSVLVDSVVQTDPYSAEIYSNGNVIGRWTGPTGQNPAFPDYAQMPLDFHIDGVPSSAADLVGKYVKEFKTLATEGSGFVPEWNEYPVTKQYVILTSTSAAGGGGGGGGGGTVELSEAEGFVDSINDPDLTISKEGNAVTLTVVSGTVITLNGQSAALGDLQLGDKASAKYDSSTNEATEIKVEREL